VVFSAGGAAWLPGEYELAHEIREHLMMLVEFSVDCRCQALQPEEVLAPREIEKPS